MKTKKNQQEIRQELQQKGWVFKKKATHAVCANQLRLTVNCGYYYSYPYMQEVWCNLCLAFGLKENYDLNPRTENDFLPDGKDYWTLLAEDTFKGVKFYEHKLSSHRIDYSKGEK